MDITVRNHQKKITPNPRHITKIVQTIIRSKRTPFDSVSIFFVTNPVIRKFNRAYLKRNYKTDVLAFETGDIIISVDMAVANAKDFQTDLNQELVLYIIHGLLHLLGYDDHKPEDIRLMRKKESQLLKKVAPLIPRAFVS